MTQKIVLSAERQLSIARARIEQLEAENHELRLALSHLTLQNKKHPVVQQSALSLRTGSCGSKRSRYDDWNQMHSPQTSSVYSLAWMLTSMCSRSHSPLTEESPSFARSTRASRLRQAQAPTSRNERTSSLDLSPSCSSSNSSAVGPKHVVVHGKSYLYHNGELTVRGCGFLVSTEATISRFGDTERWREERCGIFRPSSTDWWSPTRLGAPPKITPKPHPEPPKPTQIMTQAELEDRMELKGIALRTRLDDDAWLSDPANNIRMDHDELFNILTRAERLAKRCLWRWLRINHPRMCKRMGFHYLSDVDLGRQKMESLSFSCYERYQYRHTQPCEIYSSIGDLIQLRNRVHHFDGYGFTMKTVDEYLHDVQNLAVKLYDEESATSARDLRDRLRQGAQGVAGEIETLRLLTALPFLGQYPWQHHHVELFMEIRASPLFGSSESYLLFWDYSPSIMAATLDWSEAGRPQSPEPGLEASLANVQSLENGAHTGLIPTSSERQGARETHQVPPGRPRSASTGGCRSLPSRGQQTSVRDPTRRRSFSFGGSAEDRSLL